MSERPIPARAPRVSSPLGALLLALAAVAASAAFSGPARAAGCSPPCIEMIATAPPTSVCSGAAFNIIGHAVNCGTAPATVVVTLDGGLAQDLGSLDAGAVKVFTLTTTMGPCGPGPATYEVAARATDDCGTVVTELQTITVACGGNAPCVEVEALGPVSACAGAAIPITATVRNCSTGAETVTLTLDGGSQQNLGVLAPGASTVYTFSAVMSCPTNGDRTFEVAATAQDDCGKTTVTDMDEVTVACGIAPCVTIAASGPSSACAGAVIPITGVATNCSANDESMTVAVNGATIDLGVVAAGAGVPFSIGVAMPACGAGGPASFTVVATADAGCGPASEAQTVNVACGALPCVALSAPVVTRAACPTKPIRMRGTAVNCSAGPATIVVSIVGGSAQTFAAVAPGASVSYSFAFPMSRCIRGSSAAFTVRATATNECGSAQAFRVALVSCVPCGFSDLGPESLEEADDGGIPEADADVPSRELGADVARAEAFENASDGAAIGLYRPTPNPFSGSMSYAFRVAGNASTPVEIGVYDLAGRLVRRLATGALPAGDHVVRWDGANEQGRRATPGVYFLRARIGAQVRVDRMTILRP